ncbi:MAG: PASTA domain-containing protein [Gemmatimonadaceae bacterium]
MSWRGRLRGFLPYVLALVGGFMLAFLIVAFFIFPAGVIPRDLAVPNVIGLTYADAERAMQQVGFQPERGEQRFHTAAPRGTILEQRPAPGSSEVPGSRVTLIVSAGQKYVTIPGVIGMSREQALGALEAAGFHTGDVVERASNEPRGAVIDARPRPGVQAPIPTSVSLVISAGPTIILVPDVIGRSLDDARILLQQVGLVVGEVGWATPSAVTDAAAVVISQSPGAGAETMSRSRVNLSVGSRFP